MILGGYKANSPAKIQQGARGSATVTSNAADEVNLDVNGNFSDSTSWTPVRHTFTVKFSDARLKDLPATTDCLFQISFLLAPYDGFFLLDDVQLVESK